MVEVFGRLGDGTAVERVVLGGEALRVTVITYGAALQMIELPTPGGGWVNVALGLRTLEEYVALSPHFGAVPGRYAGRIAGGRFELDGVAYRLPQNNGANTLHGGPEGFGKRAWDLVEHGAQHVVLGLVSADGDAGFPGRLEVRVRYTVQGSALRVDYRASTDRATVLNLTNHSYFNLAGEGSGSAMDHELTVHGGRFTPLNAASVPTGETREVAGTALDFREARRIGERINEDDEQIVLGRGYDLAYLLDGAVDGAGLREAAVLREPVSGRTLSVSTSEPAVQLYTANKLDGGLVGPSGRTYRQGDAVCLETQHLADSPNQPHFPSTVLRPGQDFVSTTIFRFGLA